MSKKDNSVKIRVCILNKQNSSINWSYRLTENMTLEQVIKDFEQRLKETLTDNVKI